MKYYMFGAGMLVAITTILVLEYMERSRQTDDKR